jgi:hypothetical protein
MIPGRLSAREQQFIQRIAGLLLPWGMPLMSGRVYGYILLNQGTVSVNQIAAALGTSKVAAWKAATSLEAFGHLRRHGEPGNKRALYGPTDNFDAPLVKQAALLGALAKELRGGAASIAEGNVAPRLRAMARFYVSMQRAMGTTIDELDTRRSTKKKKG